MTTNKIRFIAVFSVLALSLALTAVVGAQATPEPIPTLALDSGSLQSGLFEGANIILAALGAIMFLIIGMTFGGKILSAIQAAINGFRFM